LEAGFNGEPRFFLEPDPIFPSLCPAFAAYNSEKKQDRKAGFWLHTLDQVRRRIQQGPPF
jgi:hypothetical protein